MAYYLTADNFQDDRDVQMDALEFETSLHQKRLKKMQQEESLQNASDPYDPANLDDDSDLHEREDWEDRSL